MFTYRLAQFTTADRESQSLYLQILVCESI